MIRKPNIVLIMCDQMRGDCMGAAGHPDVKTPYLDTLAGDGTLFSSAYSACSSCIPARAALFTGQSQKRHGRVGYEDGIPWDYPDMLPSLLAKNGYHTEAIGKMHVHPPLRRCGFNNLQLHDGYISFYRDNACPWPQHQLAHDSYVKYLKNRHGQQADINATGLNCNAWVARPWLYEEMSHPTNWAVTQSIEFLQNRDRDLPFMLFTSFVRPHPPFDAPAAYFDFYRQQPLRPPARGNWDLLEGGEEPPSRFDSFRGTPDETLQKEAQRGYYACITHVDHQIGRLLDALEAEGILEDTVVIFTSDHGELLFDHTLFRKAMPYQGSVQVPLIMRLGCNVRCSAQLPQSNVVAELRDIAPTILELAGIPVPEAMDGESLLASVYGEDKARRSYVHGEHTRGEFSHHYIVTHRDKYIWFSQNGREQYFNLEQDPRETQDEIHNPAVVGRVEELRRLLVQELTGREEGFTDGISLHPGRQVWNTLMAPEKTN